MEAAELGSVFPRAAACLDERIDVVFDLAGGADDSLEARYGTWRFFFGAAPRFGKTDSHAELGRDGATRVSAVAPIDPVTLYVGNVAGPVFATSLLAVVIAASKWVPTCLRGSV